MKITDYRFIAVRCFCGTIFAACGDKTPDDTTNSSTTTTGDTSATTDADG